MHMKSKIFIIALALSSGCHHRIPFTYTLNTEQNLDEELLKRIQFYTSHDITLRRLTKLDERQATPSAKLLIINGEQYQTINIPAGTLCAVVHAPKNRRWIDVRFEKGSNYLRFFTVPTSTASKPSPREAYALTQQSSLDSDGESTPAETWNVVMTRDPENGEWRDWYFLGASNYNKLIGTSYVGALMYAGEEWLVDDKSSRAALLIEKDALFERTDDRRTLPGVKVGSE